MKVTGRDTASTCIHSARIAKKAQRSHPAATPRANVDSSTLFPHQDDAFEDFSDCMPRAIGATEPEDAERYSRTAAWVEEFHDDGWGNAFAGESVRSMPLSGSRPVSIHVNMSATQPAASHRQSAACGPSAAPSSPKQALPCYHNPNIQNMAFMFFLQ